MENKHTPEIRFPRYIGDWEERKIGEFLKESRIPGTNGLEAKKLTVKLWGKGIIPKDEIYQGSEATKYYTRKAGQFIYGKLDFLHQAFGIIPDKLDGYESTLDSPAFDIADNLNSFFFLEYVSRKQFYLYQGTIANGSRKAKRIHSETFLDMRLIVPTVEEQTDIGNFFKNLDDTIALHQQELTTLKQTKQGFLQKMFPKEGESVPEVRFPGFTGEWEQRKLGDIGSVAMCKRIFKEQTSENGEIPFFKIGTFGAIPDSFISRELFDEYRSKYPFPECGDVLISASGTIGRTVVYNGEEAYYQDSNIVWLKRDKGQVDNSFLQQFYQIVKWTGTEGSTIKRLYNNNILSTEILLPSIREQTYIGNFFKQLDKTIALYQRELDALKETKKAFLQKMFV